MAGQRGKPNLEGRSLTSEGATSGITRAMTEIHISVLTSSNAHPIAISTAADTHTGQNMTRIALSALEGKVNSF